MRRTVSTAGGSSRPGSTGTFVAWLPSDSLKQGRDKHNGSTQACPPTCQAVRLDAQSVRISLYKRHHDGDELGEHQDAGRETDGNPAPPAARSAGRPLTRA